MNASQELSEKNPTSVSESEGPVYFQVSPSGLKHVIQNAEPRASAVYMTLAAGVNHKNTVHARGCTHGAQAIEARICLDRKNVAPRLIGELIEIDSVQQIADADESAGTQTAVPFAVKYLVDPQRVDDLVDIDQRFVDPHHGSKRRPPRRSPQHVDSDLLRMMHYGRLGGRPFTDSLLLFAELQQQLDIGTYAGVNPKVAHARLSPLRDGGFVDSIHHVMRVFGSDEQRLILVEENGFPSVDARFAEKLFGDVPSRLDESPVDRANAALGVLKALGFASSAHVIWRSDPFNDCAAEPLATLYVKGGSAFTDGHHLQHEVDAVLKRTDSISGSELYPRDAEGSKSVFSRTGIYRFICPLAELSQWVVFTQLRLKHIADSDSHRSGLVLERLRRAAYLEYLQSMQAA